MSSVNKQILIGNLGKDPELRYMPNGDPVVNFNVATTQKWKDGEGNPHLAPRLRVGGCTRKAQLTEGGRPYSGYGGSRPARR